MRHPVVSQQPTVLSPPALPGDHAPTSTPIAGELQCRHAVLLLPSGLLPTSVTLFTRSPATADAFDEGLLASLLEQAAERCISITFACVEPLPVPSMGDADSAGAAAAASARAGAVVRVTGRSRSVPAQHSPAPRESDLHARRSARASILSSTATDHPTDIPTTARTMPPPPGGPLLPPQLLRQRLLPGRPLRAFPRREGGLRGGPRRRPQGPAQEGAAAAGRAAVLSSSSC